MPFLEFALNEITKAEPEKACCRRALALGALFDADIDANGESIYIDARNTEIAEYLAELLSRRLSLAPTSQQVKRAGREYTCVTVRSPRLSKILRRIDGGEATLSEYLEFKCPSCRACFLRGVFVMRGTLTLKEANNHLELRIKHKKRADLLSSLIGACGVEPKQVARGDAVGLYYKRGDDMEDFFNLLQMNDTLFLIMNERIRRGYVMRSRRAVNCETSNIRRSVDSSQRQVRALEMLRAEGILEGLEPDLAATAKLRLENHSASYAELAKMHEPKITKAAVSRRITKLLNMADKLAAEKNKDIPD